MIQSAAIDRHIGQRLRARRRELDVSQTELGAYVGVTFQQIQKYENGSNRVSASALWLFAQRLGCTIGDFLEGVDHG